MNLENLNLVELSAQEVKSFDGGNKLKGLLKVAEYLLTAAGAYDAYNDFMDGWNSVPNRNSVSSGSW